MHTHTHTYTHTYTPPQVSESAESGPVDLATLPLPTKPPKRKKDPKKLRLAGGQVWQDSSLDDWDQSESIRGGRERERGDELSQWFFIRESVICGKMVGIKCDMEYTCKHPARKATVQYTIYCMMPPVACCNKTSGASMEEGYAQKCLVLYCNSERGRERGNAENWVIATS